MSPTIAGVAPNPKFSQGTVIRKHNTSNPGAKVAYPGLCFRIAFKWAACALKNGEFQYDNMNVVKSAAKFSGYVQGSWDAMQDTSKDWSDDSTLDDFINDDMWAAFQYINKWGMKVKDRNKVEYRNIVVFDRKQQSPKEYLKTRIDSKLTFVYGFYGRLNAQPFGHATAFSNGKFFDPNSGAFDLSLLTPPEIGKAIAKYVTDNYEGGWFPGLSLRRHVVFVLA